MSCDGIFSKVNGVLWFEKRIYFRMFRETLVWILNSFKIIFPIDGEILKNIYTYSQ